jgi:hypothetical protein
LAGADPGNSERGGRVSAKTLILACLLLAKLFHEEKLLSNKGGLGPTPKSTVDWSPFSYRIFSVNVTYQCFELKIMVVISK